MNIFKIALPGSNVKRSLPNEDAVNSLYPNPKVDTTASPPHAGILFLNWQSTGLSQPLNTTRVLYSFKHGYNYVPTVFANCIFDNGSRKVNAMLPFQIGALGVVVIDTDKDNVNLKYFSGDLSSTFPIPPFQMTIRYYVFAEQGSI